MFLIKKQFNNLVILFAVVCCFSPTLANGTNSADQIFQRSEVLSTVDLFSFRSDQDVKNDAVQKLYFFDQVADVLRFAEVKLHKSIVSEDVLHKGSKIHLNLFEDTHFAAEVISVRKNVNGTVTLMARVEDKDGYVIIATTGERSLGSIFMPSLNRYYKIISDPNTRVHYLIEMDARDRDIIESGPPLIPEETQRDPEEQKRIRKQLEQDGLGPDDPANIDVMIVYTPAAQNWANNSGGGINNVIALSMANAQLVLDNSLTLITVTLVHSSLVTYTESGNSGTDLSRLTIKNNGYMDETHTWRNQYGADLVAFFPFVQDFGGLAWLLADKYGRPDLGFSLTRVQQAATTYTHIHEMGHNMGCHHHKDQNAHPGPTDWLNWPENEWSAGWRWTGSDGGHYCTVMTYAAGHFYDDGIDHTEVPYFSNPSITYQGVAAGHPADGDNARTLREIKHVIAAYKEPQDMIEVTFFVGEDNADETPIDGALINIDGGISYTDENGLAVFMLIDDQAYTANVTAFGYVAQEVDFTVDGADVSVDVLLMDNIGKPFNLSVITEDMDFGEALFIWNDYGDEYEFRYDDGVVDAQLGYQGTINSVMGAVHFNDAMLFKMTWYLTSQGGPHNTVKVWVLGLTTEGLPDRNNVVYSAENVPNTDNEWNLYEFVTPIEMPEGFFIGLSYDGFLGLAVDDGVGEPWDFAPGTQFGVSNITNPANAFTDISAWGFEVNYLLRAYGNNLDELNREGYSGTYAEGSAPDLIPLETRIDVGDPRFPQTGQRAFLGFNVYLNDVMVAEEIMETEYLFTDLPDGEHMAGVASLYTTGSSDIVTIDFVIGEDDPDPDLFNLSFEIEDAITGDLIPNAQITLNGDEHALGFYVFENLEPGIYEYIVSHDDYFDQEGDVEIIDDHIHLVISLVPDDTSLSDIATAKLHVFPNPAQNKLFVEGNYLIEEVRLSDMLGQMVYQSDTRGDLHEIDVSAFQNGIYLLQVMVSGTLITQMIQIAW